MDIKKFMDENKKLPYEEIKEILEKKYKLRVILDYNKNYYMIISTESSDFSNNFIRNCTGTIIENNNNILHYFSEKTYDTINILNNNMMEKKKINKEKCFVSPYIDGYIIKIFYYKEWSFATSKHTNIKYFKINNSTSLYSIFESYVLECFYNMSDFLNSLDYNYCYSLILNKEKGLFFINKVLLNNLTEDFNFNNFRPLNFYNVNNIQEIDDEDKFIIIEKKDNYVTKKIRLPGKHLKLLIKDD